MKSRAVPPISAFLLAILPVLALVILDGERSKGTETFSFPTHLETEAASWERLTGAISAILRAVKEGSS